MRNYDLDNNLELVNVRSSRCSLKIYLTTFSRPTGAIEIYSSFQNCRPLCIYRLLGYVILSASHKYQILTNHK